MRATILPGGSTPKLNDDALRPSLRLIAENAAEEAQMEKLMTQLKQAGANVSQYGQPTAADYMAVGLEVELA
jgi:hypothetical protein